MTPTLQKDLPLVLALICLQWTQNFARVKRAADINPPRYLNSTKFLSISKAEGGKWPNWNWNQLLNKVFNSTQEKLNPSFFCQKLKSITCTESTAQKTDLRMLQKHTKGNRTHQERHEKFVKVHQLDAAHFQTYSTIHFWHVSVGFSLSSMRMQCQMETENFISHYRHSLERDKQHPPAISSFYKGLNTKN